MKLNATKKYLSRHDAGSSDIHQSGIRQIQADILAFSAPTEARRCDEQDQQDASEERTKKFLVPEELLRLAGKVADGSHTPPPRRTSSQEAPMPPNNAAEQDSDNNSSDNGSVLLAYLEEDERRAGPL